LNEVKTPLCFQGKKFCGRNFRENKGFRNFYNADYEEKSIEAI